jgi:cytochrome c nitrite reductase small subunit
MLKKMKSPFIARIILGIAIGLAAGIGSYTFIYAKGASYLTNNPAACANCHIMSEHYDGWIKSSHRSVATCNDCHTPPGLIPKYLTKASNGFWHSFAFTSGRYPDPLRIKPHNREVTEMACRKCHQEIVEAIEGPHNEIAELSCIRCHSSVGHMR